MASPIGRPAAEAARELARRRGIYLLPNLFTTLNARRRLLAEHDIEKVGEKLRAMMPWIKKNKLVDTSGN